MNEEKITALEKKIQKEHGNIAGMVVLKDGRTVYENYFNGCGADDTIHVFSVTKSIVSILAALDLLGGRKPAGEFRYMEMIGPDILSGLLANTTGQPVLDFAREALFEPLHIAVASNIVLYTPQEHVAFIKKNCASGWVADEKGHNTAGWGLTLTAVDMAKIGQLYLDGGKWEGRQIVSEEWVAESTAEHSRWEKEKLSYGYLWWTGILNGYAAMGNSGNIIYVNPADKMVVSIAALFKPTAKDITEFIDKDVKPLFCGAEG